MNSITLSIAYLRARWAENLLLILLLALGVATFSWLLHADVQLREALRRDAAGVDVVVGAKGSPLQLVLSSLYHADVPTGNILAAEALALKKHPQVKQAVSLALGDQYQGFRIVGSDPAYAELYGGKLSSGHAPSKPMQVALGALVAEKTGLKIGDHFAGSHGLETGGHEHAEFHYEVVGIYRPTHSVLDRLIVTPIESVWQVHNPQEHKHNEHDEHHHDEHEHDEPQQGYDPRSEVTAVLITLRSHASMLSFPRSINQATSMQAAMPSFEITRLLSLLGAGRQIIEWFGVLLMVSSLLGMIIAIFQTMQQRRSDIALMRVLGASRGKVLRQMLLEMGLLLAAGLILGLGLSHSLIAAPPALVSSLSVVFFDPLRFLPEEGWMIFGVMGAGLLTTMLPALSACRSDVSQTLAHA